MSKRTPVTLADAMMINSIADRMRAAKKNASAQNASVDTSPERVERLARYLDELPPGPTTHIHDLHEETAETLRTLLAERDQLRDTLAIWAQQVGEAEAERDALKHKLRMIVSHATMGGTTGEDMGVNDICVKITALRNDLYGTATAIGFKEGQRDMQERAAAKMDEMAAGMRRIAEHPEANSANASGLAALCEASAAAIRVLPIKDRPDGG